MSEVDKRRYDGRRVPSLIWLGVSVENSTHRSLIGHLRQDQFGGAVFHVYRAIAQFDQLNIL